MEKRNIEIKVRLNRKEADNLFKRVKRSRLSREAYLRHLINDLVPQDAPPPDYYAMMQQLYRIGNNLNQIAQKAHTLNVIDVQRYDAAVSLFEAAVKEITERRNPNCQIIGLSKTFKMRWKHGMKSWRKSGHW